MFVRRLICADGGGAPSSSSITNTNTFTTTTIIIIIIILLLVMVLPHHFFGQVYNHPFWIWTWLVLAGWWCNYYLVIFSAPQSPKLCDLFSLRITWKPWRISFIVQVGKMIEFLRVFIESVDTVEYGSVVQKLREEEEESPWHSIMMCVWSASRFVVFFVRKWLAFLL